MVPFAPLERWAELCRPAGRGRSVVGSGSIGVPGLRSPPLRLRSGQALSLRVKGGQPGHWVSLGTLQVILSCSLEHS